MIARSASLVLPPILTDSNPFLPMTSNEEALLFLYPSHGFV
jgi:hypothetical protein